VGPAAGYLEPVTGDNGQGADPTLSILRQSEYLRELLRAARAMPQMRHSLRARRRLLSRRLRSEPDHRRIRRSGVAIFLIFKTDLQHLSLIWQEAIAVALAIAFPVIFFPFSRTVWIAMDLTFHPPGRAAERQLRGTLTERDED
jgi:hypothetical protein